MIDVYNILPKHFYNETSEKEEKIIENYKEEKKVEYKLYEELVKENNLSENEFTYFVKIISDI